jgi:NADH dehydrogenase
MLVEGRDDVRTIGDCAAVPNPANAGRPCPPTARHAMRQGGHVAYLDHLLHKLDVSSPG